MGLCELLADQEFLHPHVPQRATEACQAARVAGQPGFEILATAKNCQ